MDEIATREVVTRELWQSIPLEWVMCAIAVFLAAGLKLAGVMP